MFVIYLLSDRLFFYIIETKVLLAYIFSQNYDSAIFLRARAANKS